MAEPAEVAEAWRIPDELWEQIEPLLPPEPPHPKGGRPRAPARQMLDAIFYVLRTGIQWKALPRSLGAGSTVHDRFQEWVAAGVFWKLWQAGLLEYDGRLGLDWEWEALDGALTKAPLGGEKNRAQSDRPRQDRHQTLLANRRPRLTHWPGRRRRQSPRHEAGRAHAGGAAARAPQAHGQTPTAPVDGQRL
jgi:transposase